MSKRADQSVSSTTFPSEPRAVRAARGFVCDELGGLGLAPFGEMAGLAVSELATNVILHARTEFVVQITGLSGGGVRVSVFDGSTAVPVEQTPTPGSALGRGMRLVAQVTDAWGVERLTSDDVGGPGKVVWFEIGTTSSGRSSGDYGTTVGDLLTVPLVPPESLVDVALLNLPLQLFARETIRHRELLREMALIAFDEETSSHHVPHRLTELATELEQYSGVGAATDAARDAAIERGEASIDLRYQLPPAVGPACRRLNTLLDAAEEYCRSENLLTLATSPEGIALREWYLLEIANQIDGAPATPWTGPLQ